MPETGRTRLRDAAEWFAVMHGPDAERSRGAFETWLAASERNREAYSRIAETFSLGKNLGATPVSAPAPAPGMARAFRARRRHRAFAAAALSAVAVGIVLMQPWAAIAPTRFAPSPAVAEASPLMTAKGQIRPIRLADGSVVTLDTDSRLRVAFTDGARELWLERGRARFDVAHDDRPFTVHAAGGSVVARGTLFDVRLGAQRAGVSLLRGAVDVVAPRAGGGASKVRRLRPGDAVAFGTAGVIDLAPAAAATVTQQAWPQSLLAFENIEVGDLLAETNRYSAQPIRLADPALATRRLSGTFRVGDADRLARRLATLLDAPTSRTADGRILLGEPSR